MSRLVSEAACLEADRLARENFGFPASLLMEQAAVRLWDALKVHLVRRKVTGPLLFLAGRGNNGGDAWALARLAFSENWDVIVVSLGECPKEPAATMARLGEAMGLKRFRWEHPETPQLLELAPVWIDGLWGAGLRGPLRVPERELLAELDRLRQRFDPFVVALDLPSGLSAGAMPSDPVLRANLTLVPGFAKMICYRPLWRKCCGAIEVYPLSYPEPPISEALLLNDEDWSAALPPLSPDAHKGNRGFVTVFGGSPGMPGAVVLAARSAAAAGAGVVAVRTDESLFPLLAPQMPSFLLGPLTADDSVVRRLDAWVAGPGWGRTDDRVARLEELLASGRPGVIDADALVAWHNLVSRGGRPSSGPLILTPHPGEWGRLAGQGAGLDQAIALSQTWGVVIILKGSVTWIVASGGRRAVWDGRNPALGTGGSGDCLAGIAGALLARGLDAWEAACLAVGMHGVAGDELAAKGWFLAEELPGVIARWEAARNRAKGRI